MEIIQQLQALFNSGYSMVVAVAAIVTILFRILAQLFRALSGMISTLSASASSASRTSGQVQAAHSSSIIWMEQLSWRFFASRLA